MQIYAGHCQCQQLSTALCAVQARPHLLILPPSHHSCPWAMSTVNEESEVVGWTDATSWSHLRHSTWRGVFMGLLLPCANAHTVTSSRYCWCGREKIDRQNQDGVLSRHS